MSVSNSRSNTALHVCVTNNVEASGSITASSYWWKGIKGERSGQW